MRAELSFLKIRQVIVCFRTYEIENGEQIHQYTGIDTINSSRFSNNGLFIANSGQRGKLIVANTSDGSLMHNLEAHGGKNIWIVAISKNDEFFVNIFTKRGVKFYYLQTQI